jgi:HSP20 family protein
MSRKAKSKLSTHASEDVGIVSPVDAEDQNIADANKVNAVSENNVPSKSIFSSEGELVVDVFETKSEFVVLAAIAGVQIKDLDIAVEKDMMIIKGQRANPDDSSERKYFCQECYWGPFSKKIVLPDNINTEGTQAQINKGVLTIKIPRIDKPLAEEKQMNVELS